MKKIFLYAYDRQNLGDDLFVQTITKRYPDVQFYIWSCKENRRTFACLPNLKVIDKNSLFVRTLQQLRPSLVSRYKGWLEKRCDAVVYIGGSIFMEYPNWEQICSWWEYEAKNRPFYVLGANFGPWHTEGYRQKMAEIFSDMRDVCFRDRYSQALFSDVNTVRQAPDILFSYPIPKVLVKEKQIFVSVINCSGRDESHDLMDCDERYVFNMSRLLQGYLNDGCSLVLASFCKAEGDEDGIQKILVAMNCQDDPRVRVLAYDGTNTDTMMTAIAESAYVIATRFHATILAMAAERPVLPIVYSDKMRNVLEDLGFEGTILDLRENVNWNYDQSRHNWNNASWNLSDTIRNDAEKHFEKLDEFLL